MLVMTDQSGFQLLHLSEHLTGIVSAMVSWKIKSLNACVPFKTQLNNII